MTWASRRIVVTGGGGFLGSFVVERLRTLGCRDVYVPRSRTHDLRDRDAIQRLYAEARPDMIIHLAAIVGGIGANQTSPGRFFYDNAIMGLEVMECARQFGVSKFVGVGTICEYPKYAPVPFVESDLWNGYPEETNAPYGLAKKMLLVQGQAYRAQYGFNAIHLLPTNLYGPRDNFDPDSGHVIPALIRKCIEAKERGAREIVLWGDGSPTREFLYVEDAAEGILLAAEQYEGGAPVNLAAGREISIRELAQLVAAEVGYDGAMVWDSTRPNGQPRRYVDASLAKRLFGFEARTQLRDGINRTIAWYQGHRALR